MTGSVTILTDAGAAWADDAIAVMHAAFAQFGEAGAPSGAMLETPTTLRAELARGVRLALAHDAGRALASVKHRADDGTLSFSRLAVVPDARARGLASALVRALRADARARGLAGLSCSVRAAEASLIAWYERLGLEIVGREERRSLTGASIPVVTMRDAAHRNGEPV